MNLGEIYTTFKLNTGDFTASVGSVTGGLKKIEDGSKSATPPINTLGSEIQSMALKAAAAIGLYKLADGMISTTKESIMLAARVETLGVVMGTVGKNVGLNAQQMENYAKGVADMGITTQVSRETVIRMVQAQMDLTQATTLARIAQDAAVIGNTNSSDALEKMIYGIQTGQIEVLKTIGLNVNFENSYKTLANQVGKNAEDLNELEKTQARTNVVLEAGTRIAGTYESAMGTVGKQINTLPRFIEEAKLKFGELFKPALSVVIQEITKEVQNLNTWFERFKASGELTDWGERIKLAVQGVIGAFKGVSEIVGGVYDAFRLTAAYTLQMAYGVAKAIEAFYSLKAVLADEEGWTRGILRYSSVLGAVIDEAIGKSDMLAEGYKKSAAEWGKTAEDLIGSSGDLVEKVLRSNMEVGKQSIEVQNKVIETAKANYTVTETLTAAQRELQTKLNADIMDLQDGETGKFEAELEKRLKIAGTNTEMIVQISQWASLKRAEIEFKRTEEDIKSQGLYYDTTVELADDAARTIGQMQLKYNEMAIKNQEETFVAWGKATDDYFDNLTDIENAAFFKEKELSLERITLEAELYRDLKDYGNEYYKAQKDLLDRRVRDMRRVVGIDEKAILAWSIEETFRADQKKLLSSQNFWDGVRAAYRQNVHDQETWAQEGAVVWNGTFGKKGALESTLGSFFSDFFNGQLKSAEDYFKSFCQSVLKIFADMIAKMIAQWAAAQVASMFGLTISPTGTLITAGAQAGANYITGTTPAVATGAGTLTTPTAAGVGVGGAIAASSTATEAGIPAGYAVVGGGETGGGNGGGHNGSRLNSNSGCHSWGFCHSCRNYILGLYARRDAYVVKSIC